jgi:hypothetical protein
MKTTRKFNILLIGFILSLSTSPSQAQIKSQSPYEIKFTQCKGINRSAGEYNIFGFISKKGTSDTCDFALFMSQENDKESYLFECGASIRGQAYFYLGQEGFTIQGSLETTPKTLFKQILNCI